MGKRIEMADIDMDVSTGTIMYVDIDIFRFLYEEETFCLTVKIINGEDYEFYEEINLPEDVVIVNHGDLRRFAFKWIFENVEIIRK